MKFAKADFVGAIDEYSTAIRLDPNSVFAHDGRGNAYDMYGYSPLAVADYNIAINLNPSYYPTYYNRGVVERRNGDIEAAISDYSKAISINPAYTIAYNNRGGSYTAKAIDIDANYARAYYVRAMAKQRTGDSADAQIDIRLQENANAGSRSLS